MKLFSSSSFVRIENALDYAATKQNVISQNIANVDTPRYKAKTVSFANELTKAGIKANITNNKHVAFKGSTTEPFSIETQNNTSYNLNGNNVDVDAEMAELAKNQIYYNALVERLNGKFNAIKDVLRGGN